MNRSSPGLRVESRWHPGQEVQKGLAGLIRLAPFPSRGSCLFKNPSVGKTQAAVSGMIILGGTGLPPSSIACHSLQTLPLASPLCISLKRKRPPLSLPAPREGGRAGLGPGASALPPGRTLVSMWDFYAGAQDREATGCKLKFHEGPGALAVCGSSASSKGAAGPQLRLDGRLVSAPDI